MPIFNFGSLNVDDVYQVDHIVRPGETLAASSYRTFPGGKGNNQSVALARAGASVVHVGAVGPDGRWLVDLLTDAGIDTRFVQVSEQPTGRAQIQLDRHGQNSIVLFGGANQTLGPQSIRDALRHCAAGDWVLTQNETSGVADLLEQARRLGIPVAFNPAPLGPEVLTYPLEAVRLLILNETEAEALAGCPGSPDEWLSTLTSRYPDAAVLMTLGAEGAVYQSATEGRIRVSGQRVKVVDTTAAGDTFVGYFLAARLAGRPVAEALDLANRAAAIAVTRPGALPSIPYGKEVVSPASSC